MVGATADAPLAGAAGVQRPGAAAVESAMARLSERERAAFVLRHFEQLSTKEIGDTLGLDEAP
jgi:DNA-directed RNA polymerase specialized sigma24 family protein